MTRSYRRRKPAPNQDDKGAIVPTDEEIASRKEAIQAEWTEEERERRRVGGNRRWTALMYVIRPESRYCTIRGGYV